LSFSKAICFLSTSAAILVYSTMSLAMSFDARANAASDIVSISAVRAMYLASDFSRWSQRALSSWLTLSMANISALTI
jgi:hypothetical protein